MALQVPSDRVLLQRFKDHGGYVVCEVGDTPRYWFRGSVVHAAAVQRLIDTGDLVANADSLLPGERPQTYRTRSEP